MLTALSPLAIADVGFQLSFTATLGLVLLGRPIEERLRGLAPRLPSVLTETAALTIAASLFVTPIVGLHFDRVSLIALPANLLAVPAFPIVILGSFITAVTGFVSPDLGRLVGEVTYLLIAYLVWLADVASSLPGAAISTTSLGVVEAVVIGAVSLTALTLTRFIRLPQPEQQSRSFRLSGTLSLTAVLALLAVFVWEDALSPRDGRLVVTVLDVGQGDAILIETPQGRRILVDGGPSGSRLLQRLGEELPASVRDIDLVVLTHGHDDHVTGFVELFERYEVEGALTSPFMTEIAPYQEWRQELEERDVPLQLAVAGQVANLGPGLTLEVLGPPPELVKSSGDELNDNSVVLRLVYEDVSFLLTGDIEEPGEAALLANGGDLRSTVLKVAHHGSDGSSTPGILSAIDPRVAVISAGDNNTYDHPSPSTLLRLAGIPFLRTDLNGSVRFATDGSSLWVEFEKGDIRTVPLDALTK